MYTIDTSGKGFKIEDVKYDLTGFCYYVARKNDDFEISIVSLLNGKYVLPPTKTSDIILNGTIYPNTISGWNQCYQALQGMLVGK